MKSDSGNTRHANDARTLILKPPAKPRWVEGTECVVSNSPMPRHNRPDSPPDSGNRPPPKTLLPVPNDARGRSPRSWNRSPRPNLALDGKNLANPQSHGNATTAAWTAHSAPRIYSGLTSYIPQTNSTCIFSIVPFHSLSQHLASAAPLMHLLSHLKISEGDSHFRGWQPLQRVAAISEGPAL